MSSTSNGTTMKEAKKGITQHEKQFSFEFSAVFFPWHHTTHKKDLQF